MGKAIVRWESHWEELRYLGWLMHDSLTLGSVAWR
jgi:hypothetical protein